MAREHALDVAIEDGAALAKGEDAYRRRPSLSMITGWQ